MLSARVAMVAGCCDDWPVTLAAEGHLAACRAHPERDWGLVVVESGQGEHADADAVELGPRMRGIGDREIDKPG